MPGRLGEGRNTGCPPRNDRVQDRFIWQTVQETKSPPEGVPGRAFFVSASGYSAGSPFARRMDAASSRMRVRSWTISLQPYQSA